MNETREQLSNTNEGVESSYYYHSNITSTPAVTYTIADYLSELEIKIRILKTAQSAIKGNERYSNIINDQILIITL